MDKDKPHTTQITFRPHEGLLTEFEVYTRDVPALIKAISRSIGMTPEESLRLSDGKYKFVDNR